MRQKNALTKHFIAKPPKSEEEPDYLRLANWIESIEADPDEEVEEVAYYSGDGTPETDVISVKMKWDVEGLYDDTDEAHKLIREMEFETGEGRKIWYKQERTNGDVLEGPATVEQPVTTGGEAQNYEPLTCTIGWDRKPELTKKGEDNGESGE